MRFRMFLCVALPFSFALAGADLLRAQQAPAARAIPGFDINALDRQVEPCTDFYRFACGQWMAKNPIPPDQARWGRFDELAERNQSTLRQILETAAAKPGDPDPDVRRIGDYYASCMDEKTIEARAISPLQPELDRIAKLSGPRDLVDAVARLHVIGTNVLFRFGSEQDYKNVRSVIAAVDQGGLGLPDRDYYLKDDARSVETRNLYQSHVQRTLELSGMTSDTAAPGARQVVDFETALARISMDRVLRRDPANRYHKMSPRELQALSPAWDWSRYFSETGAPPVSSVNVRSPEFFKGLNELLARTPMDSWKTYLKWHLVRANAPFLPAAFVAESFNFFGKTLTGAPENRPRWKRCVAATDAYLGEALGKVYVRQTFGAEGKERMLKMVDAIDKAMRRDLDTLPWMSDATKKQALAKLSSIVNKIGYPDRWRDYSTLEIRRGDALGNSQRGDTFAFRRDLAKIGRPFDITEWSMTPPTVNAYAGAMNTINFPAGILQPPFFDRALDDAVNYGAIGAVIGHELTHHFDDQGRKFDANGNLNDWWTSDDAKKFEEGATCFANQYSQYVAVGDVKLNGRLTLGENTADNGGLRLAHMALMESLGGTPPAPIDGFTAEQRLFLGWGQIWCQNQRPEEARRRATVDSHSSGRYRVNGVVSNMPEFQQAFGCRADAPMVRKTMCRVW